MALNNKQIAFARNYVLGKNNASQAYRDAGYKCTNETSVWSAACRLLGNIEIQRYIHELQQELQKNTLIEEEKVVNELIAVGTSDITDIVSFTNDSVTFKSSEELDQKITKAIETIERFETTRVDKEGNSTTSTRMKLKLHSKNQALKTLGAFTGVDNDFNIAKSICRKYGWNIYFDDDNQLRTEWIGITEEEKQAQKNKKGQEQKQEEE